MNNCQFCKRPCTNLYCDVYCQNALQDAYKINEWLDGLELGHTGKQFKIKPFVISYLKTLRGPECEQCGWDGKHPIDGKSLTEVDHIDGDVENTTPNNLRILCPNCHSMTETYRGRNKNSKRVR